MLYFPDQEAEAFALYHKALDLQKHDKFEESAKAYHELLKTPLLKEVKGEYISLQNMIFQLFSSVNSQYKWIVFLLVLGNTLRRSESGPQASWIDAKIFHF